MCTHPIPLHWKREGVASREMTIREEKLASVTKETFHCFLLCSAFVLLKLFCLSFPWQSVVVDKSLLSLIMGRVVYRFYTFTIIPPPTLPYTIIIHPIHIISVINYAWLGTSWRNKTKDRFKGKEQSKERTGG